MDQGIKQKLDRVQQQIIKDADCRQVYAACAASTLPTKNLKGFGDYKIGEQIICTVK
jgi:hypothetical protein